MKSHAMIMKNISSLLSSASKTMFMPSTSVFLIYCEYSILFYSTPNSTILFSLYKFSINENYRFVIQLGSIMIHVFCKASIPLIWIVELMPLELC